MRKILYIGKLFLYAVLLGGTTIGLAQTAIPISFNSSIKSASPAPEKISASDGLYTKYVLVRWNASGSAKSFQVYRSPNEEDSTEQLLNKKSLESSWLLDYDVKPGIKYHYWVKAKYANDLSLPSNRDEGHAASTENITLMEEAIEASIGNLAINEPEKFETNPFLEPMVNDTRGADFDIDLKLPTAEQRYSPAHDLLLKFEGTIDAEILPTEKLQLHIYSNSKEAFIEDMTIVKTVIQPQKKTDEKVYSLNIVIPFPQPSGLYYYLSLIHISEPTRPY